MKMEKNNVLISTKNLNKNKNNKNNEYNEIESKINIIIL